MNIQRPAIASLALRGRELPLSFQRAIKVAGRCTALTRQQSIVLEFAAQGLLNKQIAYELSITEATVKSHMSGVYTRLRILTRSQAVAAWLCFQMHACEPGDATC